MTQVHFTLKSEEIQSIIEYSVNEMAIMSAALRHV